MNKLYVSLLLSSSILSGKFITIGTGGVSGTYYSTGQEICNLVNKNKKDTGLRCLVEATGGSLINLKNIKNNEFDFAIIQNDVIHKDYKEDKSSNIRSVMAMYYELQTLVVQTKSNINTYDDLKDKRINIGNKDSGTEATTLVMFDSIGIKKSDLKFAGGLSSVEMPDALIDDKIDGYFYMVGHPASNIKNACNLANAKLVELKGSAIDKLIKENPYYKKKYIEENTYTCNKKRIETFGVKAVLLSSTDVSDDTVYMLVKSLMGNLDYFKKLHPSYKNINKKSILEGLSVPLHSGALRYYKEIGLIK
ncbi:MAG TPA: TAXI family TRAP transporter solute-binding subunit [Arcobacter sp.]|nr:TAXI family TRAP transporter solute-binding subunit [Arcobacter sp.]